MGLIDELDRLTQPAASARTLCQPSPTDDVAEGRSNGVPGPSTRDSDTNRARVVEKQATLKELQSQVAQYGFRPGNRRSVLLRQLEDVRRALEEKADQDTSFSSSVFSSSPPQILSSPERPLSSVVPALRDARERRSEVEQQNASSTRILVREERGSASPSRDTPSDEDDDEACGTSSSETCSDNDGGDASGRPSLAKRVSAGAAKANETPLGSVPAAVAKQLLEAVRSDADVYRRILHFEPISFDEISSLAKRANVQGLRNKEMLRNWLDVQCICFYTAELTGQRQRY